MQKNTQKRKKVPPTWKPVAKYKNISMALRLRRMKQDIDESMATKSETEVANERS